MMENNYNYSGLEIAVIGMACRFPDAKNYNQYWKNLEEGLESIHYLTDDELLKLEVDEKLVKNKKFVRNVSVLEGKENFDAAFFDYTPDEAGLMNPEHRVFHECVWEALEDAGCDPDVFGGMIGLFAGADVDLNWKLYSMIMNSDQKVSQFTLDQINDKDFLTTLLSYKLDLKGPSVSVNTACSTSLVAIHHACRSLLLGESKMALAGGVSISTYKNNGYLHEEGMINSMDGHCRPFDKNSSGTYTGEGVGIVVLKRLKDAISDKDQIHAVIKGSAINNDGKRKVGYTAPSVEGQSECIKAAHKFSKVDSETITYVETHGTGTKLGDPIEIEALNVAFNSNNNKFCALGSVKSNIGHLSSAAGVAGFIKTVLCLKNKKIPASLNFKEPNPEINFDGGPFYVNTSLKNWDRKQDKPLRAGVSSFGIGGTNAHLILEEAPHEKSISYKKQFKLLTLSAKTENSLARYIKDFSEFLSNNNGINLTNVAYTTQTSRKHFNYRKSILFKDFEDLKFKLNSDEVLSDIKKTKEKNKSVVFMFSGQGSQYFNMGKDLYNSEPIFKNYMDKGFGILEETTGISCKEILFGVKNDENLINQTRYSQPLIFILEYSLANFLISIGISPKYMIGHSIGEYVAACVSGVFSFEDGLKLVIKRGELMNRVLPGSMLSVAASADQINEYLNDNISLAAINAPMQNVLSGSIDSIDDLIRKLDAKKIPYIKLQTSHAFHSSMQDSIIDEFKDELSRVVFNKSSIPFISNLTGDFIVDEDVCSANYWAEHLRNTVLFSIGIQTLLSKESDSVFIEIGAGKALCSLIKQHTDAKNAVSINMIRAPKEVFNDLEYLTNSIGKIWTSGVQLNWNSLYKDEEPKRISIPTYSFEKSAYPVEVDPFSMIYNNTFKNARKKNADDWFYRITWKQSVWLVGNKINVSDISILCFVDSEGVGKKIVEKWLNLNVNCVLVIKGTQFEKRSQNEYVINSFVAAEYDELFSNLWSDNIYINKLVYVCEFAKDIRPTNDSEPNINQNRDYQNLILIVKNYTNYFSSKKLQLDVVGNGWYNILGNESLSPINSVLLGAVKVIPLEFLNISCRAIEIVDSSEHTIDALFTELNYVQDCAELAIRGKNRYVKDFEKIDFKYDNNLSGFVQKGNYLITGANGGMAKIFSEYLAKNFNANLVLVGRGDMDPYISELKNNGHGIYYLKADIIDSVNILEGIKNAESIFGEINGVIHTAGLGDFGGIILRRTDKDDDKVFLPKIQGTNTLHSIFENRKLDFFINCSSHSASLAEFGQIAYVAANIYQDTFAERGSLNYPIISIEWTTIKEVEMAVNAIKNLSDVEQNDTLLHGILPTETIMVLERAIYLKIPTQIISVYDFKQLYEDRKEQITKEPDIVISENKKERPNLAYKYVEPRNDIEIKLKLIFENFFGITNIGIQDDFFELGGDSLKAMVIIRRIENEFSIDIGLHKFFQAKNIAEIATLIEDVMLFSNNTIDKKNHTII